GPGHVPGTSSPGARWPGNTVIAGHRDSFFRRLADVRSGDVVFLRGMDGAVSTYRLESKRVVAPENVAALAPSSDSRLTLTTCYPFRWIGPAPYRLIWTASAAPRPTTLTASDTAPSAYAAEAAPASSASTSGIEGRGTALR